MSDIIYLTGFSYTGKTTLGRIVADRLGWSFVDTDEQIALQAGKSVPEIFASDGEAAFRSIESRVLEQLSIGKTTVVSTGGGAVLSASNRQILSSGVVISIEASPATILERLKQSASADAVPRPLLQGDDPLRRIEHLKQIRQQYYSSVADWVVTTDLLSETEAAEEILRGYSIARRKLARPEREEVRFDRPNLPEGLAPYCSASGATCEVSLGERSYPIFVGWNLLDELGNRLRNAGLADRVYLLADTTVLRLHGEHAISSLAAAGFSVAVRGIEPGERSKSLATAGKLYDWLASERAERQHPIVAMGGGVVGDLAGFIAATYLRGLPLVHVPTTLLAMVDSSIGGKTGVNLPHAKNLVGAFYQPRLVLADIATLTSLPRREYASGWAEVIKHAMALDEKLFSYLADHQQPIGALEPDPVVTAIGRSSAIKAAVVSHDEREGGQRMILNYGHTIGHGVEAATRFRRYLHGEAVAIGMHGAALLSHRMGMLPLEAVDAQREMLEAYGLPTRARRVDPEKVRAAMALDKKVTSARLRWVLPTAIGTAVVRSDVPAEDVEAVLAEVMG
ncbi:MAG: 3-dehydroquinate synthase [Chloroflexota bacterium]|nr:MAG: 3-dehydroquinate synthase [Chloroflexota bacterium]